MAYQCRSFFCCKKEVRVICCINNTYERMKIISTLLTAILQLWVDLPVLLGYLKGQSFPQPFTKEEEAECLERYLNGDESAKMELIERNMRLVAHVVKKFHPKHEQLDDYISIGTIGLMKAVGSFTPQKKTRLATYAARCIENEILMHLRSQKLVPTKMETLSKLRTFFKVMHLLLNNKLNVLKKNKDYMNI
jgi:RNA polymerase sporulation-specific sigma factor